MTKRGRRVPGAIRAGGFVNPLATVTRDATSGKYFPSSAAEWTTFLAVNKLSALGNPNSLWLCQEASGNLADSIGSLTLTANATPLYQQTVTGVTRKGVGFANAANQRFSAAAGVGPNPTTTSMLWLGIGNVTSKAATRCWGGIGGGANKSVCEIVLTTGVPRKLSTGVANVSGALDMTATGVQPMAFNFDRTGSRNNIYTAQEKVIGNYDSAIADGNKGIGDIEAATSFTGSYVYLAMWSGAPGEMSDANLKLLLQAMGYTIGW